MSCSHQKLNEREKKPHITSKTYNKKQNHKPVEVEFVVDTVVDVVLLTIVGVETIVVDVATLTVVGVGTGVIVVVVDNVVAVVVAVGVVIFVVADVLPTQSRR